MNYSQGISFVQELVEKNESGSYDLGDGFVIDYPGFKHQFDYKLSVNGNAPKHTDIVDTIHNLISSNTTTYENVVSFLQDVYTNGLNATITIHPSLSKKLIYWITLQEEINYPYPKLGRKMPFSRYFEAALVAKKLVDNTLGEVRQRTDVRGFPPSNWTLNGKIKRPTYY